MGAPLMCAWLLACGLLSSTAHAATGRAARVVRTRLPLRPAGARVRCALEPATSSPALVDNLRAAFARGDDLERTLEATQPFPLDGFQREALQALIEGENVLLSAPTGSGKTAVGELAVLGALARGQRAVYTTPLKALSNQKFFDFCERFGTANVGLLTGDVCVQRDAPILLMTTEVFRNMLFDEADSPLRLAADAAARGEGAAAGAEEGSRALRRGIIGQVGICVLDEFHWMGDKSRGVTWEEVVIHAPRSVQLLALSATVPNGPQLRRWIEATHGRPTRLVRSDDRPVPLRFHFADGARGVQPLFDDPLAMPAAVAGPAAKGGGGGGGAGEKAGGGAARARGFGAGATDAAPAGRARGAKRAAERGALRLNPDLVEAVGAPPAAEAQRRSAGGGGGGMRAAARRAGRGQAQPASAPRSGGGGGGGGGGRQVRGWDDFPLAAPAPARAPTAPSMQYLVRCLQRKQMLPAIVFIFSRAGCDQAAAATAADARALLSTDEARGLKQALDAYEETQRALGGVAGGADVVDARALALLRAGVASHHAGQLPAYKKLAERLFAANLLKVVFATETLAAGINMPCRTAVVTALSKRGDAGIEPLGASALLQMAGRAGRRGKDAVGHVVLAQSRWEGAADAFRMVQRAADPIRSHFLLSYSSVLRTVTAAGGLEGARRVLDRSYGAFARREAEAEADKAAEAGGGGGGALATRGAARADALASEAEAVRAQLRAELGVRADADAAALADAEAEAAAYGSLVERLAAEENILGWLAAQAERDSAERLADLLAFAQPGARLRLLSGESALLLRGAGTSPALAGAAADVAAGGVYAGDELVVLVLPRRQGDGDAGPEAAAAAAAAAQPAALSSWPSVAVVRSCHVLELEMEDIEPEAAQLANLAAQGPLAAPARPRPDASSLAGARAARAVPTVRLPPPICGARGWEPLADGSYRCPTAALGPEVDDLLRALAAATRPLAAASEAVEPPQVLQQLNWIVSTATTSKEVLQQRARLARLAAEVAASPLHSAAGAEEIARLGAALAPLDKAEAKQRRREARRGGASADPAAGGAAGGAVGGLVGGYSDVGMWDNLLGAHDVLQMYGALEPIGGRQGDAPRLTEFGRLVASLGGENELFLGATLMSAHIFKGCAPHEVAAALSTLAAGEMRQGSSCMLMPSEKVLNAAAQIEPIALALLDAQGRAGVDYPVSWSSQYAGLVQAWAAGMEWTEVMEQTSLDAGDVLRLLTRTNELLRQVLIAPFVPQLVRESAREAFATFDRPPIADSPLADAQRAEAAERRSASAAATVGLSLDVDDGEAFDDDGDDDDDYFDDDVDLVSFGAEPEPVVESR